MVLLNLNPDHDEMQAFVASVMAADASICPAVIVLARSDQRAQAIEALHAGAFDWQALPVDLPLLTHAVARATEQVKLRRVERLFRDLMDTTP